MPDPYDTQNQLGGLGNQDLTSSKDAQNPNNNKHNPNLYTTSADQLISENQDDQDLADDPSYADVDYNDDQYDIQGGQGLYGTGDYANQGGPSKPASDRDRYGTKVSQDQNGYQQ